jgi:hypothetical protein
MSHEIRHQQQQRHQQQHQQQEQLKQQQLQLQEQQKQQHNQAEQQADGGNLTQKAEAAGTVLSAIFAGLTYFQDLFRRKRRGD